MTNRVGVAAVVSAVIGGALAMSPALAGLPAISPASGSGAAATQYPARLDYVYWDDDQPSATGPLAGVVQSASENMDGWYTVSPEGHLWHLADSQDAVPALSPDGSHLGYMKGSFLDATYVIVSQLDGTTTNFRQIGTSGFNSRVEDFDDDHRYWHSDQQPAFWSPDGAALLLQLGTTNPDDPLPDLAAAVLRTDGTFVTVPQPTGAESSLPIGWIDEDHVALAGHTESAPANVRVWVIDTQSGHVVRDFILEDGARFAETGQWFGSLSPNGSELATAALQDEAIRFYSMRGPNSGDIVTKLSAISAPADSCLASWSSSDYYVPTYPTPDGDASILARATGGATIVADPRLGIDCSTWARTALDGKGHLSLGARFFGQQDNWISWHWREVTSSVLLALAIALGIGFLGRRRTGPST